MGGGAGKSAKYAPGEGEPEDASWLLPSQEATAAQSGKAVGSGAAPGPVSGQPEEEPASGEVPLAQRGSGTPPGPADARESKDVGGGALPSAAAAAGTREPRPGGQAATVKANWTAQGKSQLPAEKGASVILVEESGQWAWCKLGEASGWLPRSYVAASGEEGFIAVEAPPVAAPQPGAAAAAATQPAVASAQPGVPSATPQPEDAGGPAGGARPASGGGGGADRGSLGSSAGAGGPQSGGAVGARESASSSGGGQGSGGGDGGGGGGGGSGGDSPGLPEAWTSKLTGTMILHTVQNAMRLAAYLLQLLTGGYGTVSPLHIACWEGSTDALEAITRGSADAVQGWHSRRGDLTPLHIGSMCGHSGVIDFLVRMGVDPNVVTVHGLSALHISASSSTEVSEALVSGKADVHSITADRDTPLHFACCYQQISTMELVMKEGCNPSSANNFGVTPLHIAVAYTALEGLAIHDARAVLMLCSHRANPSLADKHGRTALDIALMAGGDPSLIDFLRGASGEGGAERTSNLAVEMLDTDLQQRERQWMDQDQDNLGRQTMAGWSRQPRQAASAETQEEMARMSAERSKLAEENAAMAAKIAELSKELQEAKSSAKHFEELLSHSRGLLEQTKAMAASSANDSQAQTSEAMQQLKDELELERSEFRQRQQALGEERDRWQEEKEALQQQLDQAVADRDVAVEGARVAAVQSAEREREAKRAEDLQAKVAAEERARQERERAEEEARAALGQKEALLGEKDEELRQRLLAEQEVRSALSQKETELSERLMELEALRQELEQKGAELAAAQTAAQRSGTELEKARAENKRLDGDLRQKVKENEEVWNSLQDVRAQHSKLREEHSSSQQAHKRAEAAWREKEATLEGRVKELELQVRKLEQDLADSQARVLELDGCRERAEYADRMLRPLEQKVEGLRLAFNQEQALRKRYHNQIQDFKGAIRVYARIRPRVKRESGDTIACRKVDTDTLELEDPKRLKETKPFTFDSVFDEFSSQEDVFSECKTLVSSAFDGYNVTVFAYGQTGAGKTHTMYGNDSDPGLVPRIAEELFSILAKYSHESQSRVKCSMFELYRDDLVDLYRVKGSGARPLEIKKDARGSVYVENATDREVTSPSELLKAIDDGMSIRHVAATQMNAHSSRSHLIFTIVVETTNKASKQVSTGKLTLCDLAGSERVKKSEASGEQMKEAQSINKSLSALGDVIEALTKHQKHVPYRNHKLTQLMSDSLGGNAKTLMFVNCSPVSQNADETGAALGYAARAKMIMNKVEKNQDSQEVARLKKVIQVMGKELDQARTSGGADMPPQLPAVG